MLLFLLVACQGDQVKQGGGDVITWDDDRVLEADTTVPAGQTLVIAPGVTVSAAEGVRLIVQGELVARGEEDAPIVFTGDPEARWGGIALEDGAVDADFEDVDAYVDGSILEQVVIENATRGLALVGAAPYLHAVTFQDNEIPSTVDTIGGAALLVADGAAPRVRDCLFQRNVANAFAFGGALYVDGADPIVQDSTFEDNSSSYGGAIATDRMAAPIVGSVFTGNDSISDGGALSLVSTVSALLHDTVSENTARKDGGGVHVCVDCDPHAAPHLLDTVITGNATSADDPDGDAGGVGAAFLGAFVGDEVHDNTRDGEPSDFGWFNLVSEDWPDWVSTATLSDTWWGTTDPDAVAEAVWDGADSDRYGLIEVDAPREGPIGDPLPRVVLATRRTRYEDAGEAIPIFLTLYNPGPEARFTLTVTRDGAAWADLDLPLATAVDGGWSLDLPENAVWFGQIAEEQSDGVTESDITWEATLLDADGAMVGVPSLARYLTGAP